MHREDPWDCVVIGGGAAGLSAALVLGRARRRTLLLDAGGQSNLVADHIGGLLGYDQRPAPELYAAGTRELAAYPSVEVRRASATGIAAAGARADGRDAAGGEAAADADAAAADAQVAAPGAWRFAVQVGERAERTRSVILATGADYIHAPLPGLAEQFGRSVFHCPFCHGWEHREGELGVLDPSPAGPVRARLLTAWSDRVTLFTDGPADLDQAARDALAARGIALEERPVTAAEGDAADGSLARLRLEGGAARACTGLLVGVTLAQRGGFADDLGLARQSTGHFAGQTLAVDMMGQTSHPGIYAAGDCATANPSVASAVLSGSVAAAGVVHALAVGG